MRTYLGKSCKEIHSGIFLTKQNTFIFSGCGENEYVPYYFPCPPINCGDHNNTFCEKICIRIASASQGIYAIQKEYV